jgi:two-component system cell cycle sensor histidine kinase/response regulator CckA
MQSMSFTPSLRVLILEDNADDAELVVRDLRRAGFAFVVDRALNEAEFLSGLERSPHLILADYQLPGYNVLAALRTLRERGSVVPLIVISGTIGEEAAAECLREGATDYLLKDRLGRLGQAVRNAVERARISETERRSSETLRQAQKMEAVGRLAGGVAHDFNNILTTILGYAELLAARAGDRADLLGPAREIRLAGERAAALTRQLLTFSRQQSLERRILDVNEVVSGVEGMLRRLLSEHLTFTLTLWPRPCLVLADRSQLEQVVINLVLNARDAMPSGGSLLIETSVVEHGTGEAALRSGRQVVIAVSDTGRGMDAAIRSHIFEPFFTTKEPGQGTGLGLATVYGVVHQSGGSLEVASEPGQGSTFRIYLPRAAGEVERRSSLRPAAVGGTETVLVLEDDAVLRSLVVTMLEAWGYTVLAPESPPAAIALAERYAGAIHLVVSDLVMPGMSGPEATARLLAIRPEMRVLFVSGYSGEAIGPPGALLLGAPLLAKPFSQQDLLRRVRQVLDATAEVG